MRSKEVEEAIEKIKLHKNYAQIKNDCFITNIINADILLAYIEELEKDVKDAMDGYQDLGKEVYFNFISKDKIKDKIEEYLEFDKKYKTYTKDGRENFSMEYFKAKALKELLGE